MTAKRNKANIYNAANSVGNNAPLQTKANESQPTGTIKASRPKNIRAMPTAYFDAHTLLKSENKTSLDFSSYILEALREKLERDGAI